MATTTTPAPVQAGAKSTVTATMSQWAAELKYEQLSQDAIYQAKRFLLDSIGCALGGYQQHDVAMAREVLDEIAGPGKATVIGSGKQMDAVTASLANALMIRCMDYNDIYWKQDPSHPSDIFPAAMACCILVQSRCSIRAATIGDTKAVSVAWCHPRSRIPGKAASHIRISNS